MMTIVDPQPVGLEDVEQLQLMLQLQLIMQMFINQDLETISIWQALLVVSLLIGYSNSSKIEKKVGDHYKKMFVVTMPNRLFLSAMVTLRFSK